MNPPSSSREPFVLVSDLGRSCASGVISEKNPFSCGLSDLPNELIIELLNFLPSTSINEIESNIAVKELLRCSSVCRRWLEIISISFCLWKGRFLKFTMNNKPAPRVYHSAVVHNDKLIIFGGHVPSDNGDWIAQVRSDLWEFDINKKIWTLVANQFPYTESPAVIYNNVMYIFSGFGSLRTNLLLTYDTTTKKLTCGSPTANGIGRSAHTAVQYRDHVYIFGGYSGRENLDHLVQFNFTDKQFTAIKYNGTVPGIRAHSSVVYKDCMYVIGGYLNTSHNEKMYKYSFGNNTWSVVECFGDAPCVRSRLNAVVYGNKMYVVGGATGASRNVLLKDFYEFDFETSIWKRIEIDGLEGGIAQHSLCVYKNQLLMFGGFVNGNATNDLYTVKLS